jgi:dethiobiotin synthetase
MRLFITSTGTGVGKTFITGAMARQARAAGRSVAAYKPVISGFDPAQVAETDTGVLLESCGLPLTAANIERVSPFRYAAPLAPSMAARRENCALDFHALIAHSQMALQGPEDLVLIEGVGGVMVPLNDRRLVLDWIEALGIPVVLVVGTYLGSLSHTLTALSVLRQRHVPIHEIVVNESENSPVSLELTVEELRGWTEAAVRGRKRLGN